MPWLLITRLGSPSLMLPLMAMLVVGLWQAGQNAAIRIWLASVAAAVAAGASLLPADPTGGRDLSRKTAALATLVASGWWVAIVELIPAGRKWWSRVLSAWPVR